MLSKQISCQMRSCNLNHDTWNNISAWTECELHS